MKFSILSAIAYLTYAAAAPIPEDTAVLRRETVPGVLSFNLDHTAGSFERTLGKRDKYMSYQAGISNERDSYYTLDLGVGFPQQSYKFLIDTTSPAFWIANNTDITDKPYYFNGDTMLVANSENLHSHAYFDGSSVNFTSAVTQVKVARKTVRDVPLGVAYNTDSIDFLNGTSGFVGLGSGSEILSLLKEQGYTNRTGFALSLYNDRSVGANIMFGGVDHGKYKGKLWTMPRLDVDNLPTDYPYNGVKVNSISIGKELHEINSTFLLDAANTFSYVPESIYNALVDYYEVDTSDEAVAKYGAPMFDIQKNGGKQTTLDIAGAKIKFEGNDIAMPDPPHIHRPKHHRVFGFKPNTDSNVSSFGISVLRSMYVVFDYDGDRIAIAQIDKNPGSTHLIPISDNIKYSKPAPDFQ